MEKRLHARDSMLLAPVEWGITQFLCERAEGSAQDEKLLPASLLMNVHQVTDLGNIY